MNYDSPQSGTKSVKIRRSKVSYISITRHFSVLKFYVFYLTQSEENLLYNGDEY